MDQIEFAVDFLRERLGDGSVDDFEVYVRAIDSLEVESRDQQVESFARSRAYGVAVRVAKAGRMGMSSSSEISAEELDRVVAQAVAAGEAADETDTVAFAAPLPGIAALAERPGRPLCDIDDEEKTEAARRLERAVLAADPSVVRARKPVYAEKMTQVIVLNSQGVMERAQRGMTTGRVQAVAERGGMSEAAWECDHHIRFDDLDCEEIGRRAGVRAASLIGAAPVPTGSLRAYFEPRAAAAMLKIFMPSFFAENVQRRKSRLTDKRGKQVVSSLVTIIDDGLFPGGAGSFPFDAEGVVNQRTPVVVEGVVRGWLYDAASARRDVAASTGNAWRDSIHAPPQIAVSNSFVDTGTSDPSELVASCNKGLWVSELLGLHTANTISGDFSLGMLGYVIEGGRRGRPVRGVVAAGTVIEFFKGVDGVGDDLAFFGQYGAPSLTVRTLQIDGS